jgi:hypothetical protein
MQIKNENQTGRARIATVECNDGPESNETGTVARAVGEDMKRL